MDQVLSCIIKDAAGSSNAAEARTLIARVAAQRGVQARISEAW